MARSAARRGRRRAVVPPALDADALSLAEGQPELRVRVVASLVFLLLATAATSVSPLFFGWAVDALAHKTPAEIVLAHRAAVA